MTPIHHLPIIFMLSENQMLNTHSTNNSKLVKSKTFTYQMLSFTITQPRLIVKYLDKVKPLIHQ